ncbi:MAG TPA: hypothetical protein VGS80_13685 [Ktedonobacterales bacterium]|nr:hypothetical protein [Ktedonobacterales bacterium]
MHEGLSIFPAGLFGIILWTLERRKTSHPEWLPPAIGCGQVTDAERAAHADRHW